jgi:hypothetical protein
MFRAVKKRAILRSEINIEKPILRVTRDFDVDIIATSIMGRDEMLNIVAVRVTVKIPCHLNCPLLR